MPGHGDTARWGMDGSRQRLEGGEEAGRQERGQVAITLPRGGSSTMGFLPAGSSARILHASVRVPPFCHWWGGHKEGRLVALPRWLGMCRLGHGPPTGWERWPDRALVSLPPGKQQGLLRGQLASRYPQLVLVWGGSPRWFFPLADAEQSSSPRTGIGSDQEDSKPITLGEQGGQGSGKGSRAT